MIDIDRQIDADEDGVLNYLDLDAHGDGILGPSPKSISYQ